MWYKDWQRIQACCPNSSMLGIFELSLCKIWGFVLKMVMFNVLKTRWERRFPAVTRSRCSDDTAVPPSLRFLFPRVQPLTFNSSLKILNGKLWRCTACFTCPLLRVTQSLDPALCCSGRRPLLCLANLCCIGSLRSGCLAASVPAGLCLNGT